MNTTEIAITDLFSASHVFTLLKFAVVFAVIIHVIVILLIHRQVHQADKLGSPLIHKLIEIFGYINIILSIIILVLLALP
jgi:hypothetical protein